MATNKMNQRGQITIFIILALIIIVILAMFFLVFKAPEPEVIDEDNPQAFIESCTKQAVEEALEVLMPSGGDIIPKGSIMYNDLERTYLCYNANYYSPCINQRPLLIEHIENEITSYIEPRVANCFNILESKLENRYTIESGEMQIQTKLSSGLISINIDKHFKMSRAEIVRNFENFKVSIPHPLYELSKVALEIVNLEARFCNFDILGYMIFYPKYDMDKFRTGDSNIIYTINDRATNEEFMFAIRSCALPPGF